MIDSFRDRAHDTVGLMICFLGSSTHRQFFPRRFAHEVFLLSRHFKLLEIKLLPHPRFLLFLQRIQWMAVSILVPGFTRALGRSWMGKCLGGGGGLVYDNGPSTAPKAGHGMDPRLTLCAPPYAYSVAS